MFVHSYSVQTSTSSTPCHGCLGLRFCISRCHPDWIYGQWHCAHTFPSASCGRPLQDLEDRQTPEALESAQAELATVHDQVKQLQQQLQQAQSAAAELSSTKTQLILLQSQLHQQRELCQHQSVAAEGLTAGLERERNSWQAEHQSLSTRAQVQQQYIHNAALQWGAVESC